MVCTLCRRALLVISACSLFGGCLQVASSNCDNGGVCPPGLQCANTGNSNVCILATCGNGQLDAREDCEDGNNISGDGCPANCIFEAAISVLPTIVTFTASEGDPPPAAVAIHTSFLGDEVFVGYPPGAPVPSWLSIEAGSSGVNVADFVLQVTDTSVGGEYSTSVRFQTKYQEGTTLGTFDLPITYNIGVTAPVAQAMPPVLSFSAASNGPIPPPKAVEVTFGGTSATVVDAPPWVTVSPPPDPVTSPAVFSVAINNTTFAASTVLSGDIVFDTQNAAGTRHGSATVHVDYNVISAPETQFAAPYAGVAGRGGTLRVRGRGFRNSNNPVTVSLGDVAIGPLIPDSDTQIVLSYPPLPEGRYPVTISNPPGIAPRAPELVIVTPPPLMYQAIDAPSPRTRIVYDAERQAIYGVNRLDQQIERFMYADGIWVTLAPRIIPQLTDIAMAPDGRSLIVLDRAALNEISLTDGAFAPVRRIGIPDTFCGRFFEQAAAADNGKIFVVVDLSQCSGAPQSYLYDIIGHTLSIASSLYNGLVGASGDGSRIYAGENGLSPSPAVRIFESLSNTISTSLVHSNLTAVSVSGDASRVILDNRSVYSRSLTLTGNVPFGGVALASRDSSRAFVYRDDAPGPRLEAYNLNGELQSGALYPLLKTVMLPDSPNSASGFHRPVAMTSSLDDAVVFVSGDSKLLVVPVD